MNSDGSNVTRLTFHNAIDTVPDWSPDGSKVLFASNRVDNFEVYVMNADGSNVKRLTSTLASTPCPTGLLTGPK